MSTDFNDLCFYAFRYILPRRTYAVSQVCEILIRHKEMIDSRTKQTIIKEIDKELEIDVTKHQCDIDSLLELRRELSD